MKWTYTAITDLVCFLVAVLLAGTAVNLLAMVVR